MRKFLLGLLVALGLVVPGSAETPTSKNISPFGWQFESLPLRGGTSKGEPVTLRTGIGENWARLQQPGLSAKERDRRAILAMAGSYRASFEFVETAGFSAGYQPSSPYRSWGTEVVYVLKDSPDKIVLQHVLLMRASGEEPVVVKHWRQDWQFEPETVLHYQGDDTWRLDTVPVEERNGAWSQTVYQVDDSPRYGGVGRWRHEAGASIWTSDPTWRPLPRREFTVRSDYHVLAGVNRHIITPTGWIHEQENNKLVVENGGVARVVARELGLNRYELLENFDTAAADNYIRASEPFWKLVRAEWARQSILGESYTLRPGKERSKLAQRAFAAADEIAKGETAVAQEAGVRALVREYFTQKAR